MNNVPFNSQGFSPMPGNLTSPPPLIQQTPAPNPAPTTPAQNSDTSSSLPTAKIFMGIIPVFVFAVVGIISFSIVNDQKQKATFQSSAAEPVKTISQQQPQNQDLIPDVSSQEMASISASVLGWIDKTKGNDGVYFSGVNCENGSCTNGFVSRPAGAQVIWARFQHFAKTGDNTDLQKINQDLTTYLDPKVVPYIQNRFFSCKLLYEIISSKNPATSSLNDKLAELCNRNTHNPFDLNEINALISKNEDKDPNLDSFLVGQAQTTALTKNQGNLLEPEILSSEYSTRFLWFSDPTDLRRAKQYFIKATMDFDSKLKSADAKTATLGIASLDLYQATQEKKYMEIAETLFPESGKCSEVSDCAYMAMFARQMFLMSNEDRWKQLELQVLKTAIAKGYDVDQKAFHTFGNTRQTFDMMNNSFLAGLLINQ